MNKLPKRYAELAVAFTMSTIYTGVGMILTIHRLTKQVTHTKRCDQTVKSLGWNQQKLLNRLSGLCASFQKEKGGKLVHKVLPVGGVIPSVGVLKDTIDDALDEAEEMGGLEVGARKLGNGSTRYNWLRPHNFPANIQPKQ
jgi:hypothetical protein